MQPAADDAVPQPVLMPAEDRGIRGPGDRLDRVERHHRMARAVVRDTHIENDRVGRQRADACFELRQRQAGEVVKGDARGEWLALRPEEVGVEPVERRNAADDEDMLRIGPGGERRGQRARQIDRRDDAGRVRSTDEAWPRGEDERHIAKQRGVSVQKIDDGRSRRDDEVEPVIDIARAEIAAQRRLVFRIPEPIEIDVLAVIVEAVGERLSEHRSKRVVETGESRLTTCNARTRLDLVSLASCPCSVTIEHPHSATMVSRRRVKRPLVSAIIQVKRGHHPSPTLMSQWGMNDLAHVESVKADCGCAVGIPGEGGVNRDGKIIRRRMFEHEPGCPCAERRSCHPLIAASGDQDDLRLRRGVLDMAARIDSIHLRHRQVGDDDVRGECARGFEQAPVRLAQCRRLRTRAPAGASTP